MLLHFIEKDLANLKLTKMYKFSFKDFNKL